MKIILLITALFCIASFVVVGKELHIGEGQPYSNLYQAVKDVNPGDTILFHEGVYDGGQNISNFQGNEFEWITIKPVDGENVIIRGGSKAWQFSTASYIWVTHIIFEQQTGNGLNMDDGGEYSKPGHHLKFTNCIFRDMVGTGNNDLLKITRIDHFEVNNCQFINGASGGSGIDMVGCHNGLIANNYFENMGSNAIQAKGGSQNITIEKNIFVDAGNRSINLGGSTGLQYFKPIDAPFEAADINVYSNIFIGSEAPIAFVGCTRVKVVNNTIYKPNKWVIRILQETVEESRFVPCSNNYFQNNIIYQSNLYIETNIGPNTQPETFIFSNNFWYNYQNNSWDGPSIPVTDSTIVINKNPLFENSEFNNFNLNSESPAIGIIENDTIPKTDFYGNKFNNPRSAGAIESGNLVSNKNNLTDNKLPELKQNYPNPFSKNTTIEYFIPQSENRTFIQLKIFDSLNREVAVLVNKKMLPGNHKIVWDRTGVASRLYFVVMKTNNQSITKKLIVCKNL